ncbi:MAG: tRNA uridine-5-carboxymethylaminomethyl(34) synthesis GTPase MnmE [Methylocystis sp.]|nr:tRNA uridine-5-carboxymethylaminomethyl(34) synthesis GTPase MnmE [Methylocystis sp.]MCA3583280.1 tRNA uridine-5-carboxymethylaminomethyl(34) synthesis GTPase MnmE [Methylocystis sp.]MCA3588065.1 tRNA uridine-5-carboxymethylaminomethyl(34) synthesis GTPase MnmE [Methylocystis sp.]MCA3591493.1 tRNA uridine-5-carboxymethylaminomethyl(34) synthesis GTPase MnmE [Methylocystis sp.]
MTETVFSLSSGKGKAGIAVIRISGPLAGTALLALAGALPPLRQATLMTLRRPGSDVILDRALVLLFARDRSFTGEPVAELHVHGGPAVVRSVLGALAEVPGLRMAVPGEFTRQALGNGRIDLGQVEALADLIDAETERQRMQALSGLAGMLGAAVRDWRSLLLEAKAMVAADIDFSDEGDVADQGLRGIDSLLQRLESGLEGALRTADRGRMLVDGFRVAIIGPPNAGKSTLLNALARRDVAIVSEHAGTTRDVLEVKLDIDGYAVILADTAGLRETSDPVERMGIERARTSASKADLVLLLDDGESEPPDADSLTAPSIRVRTKIDRKAAGPLHDISCRIHLSAHTGEGLDSLTEQILLAIREGDRGEPSLLVHERQRQGVERALAAVQGAQREAVRGVEFLDHHLQRADDALKEVIGLIGVEEVLGAVFSRFCIGK